MHPGTAIIYQCFQTCSRIIIRVYFTINSQKSKSFLAVLKTFGYEESADSLF